MASPEPRGRRARWLLAASLLIAIACASASLGTVLEGSAWWLMVTVESAAVLAAAGAARRGWRARWLPPLVAAVAHLLLLTVLFAPLTAIAAVLPTPETLSAFAQLVVDGAYSIGRQGVPAVAEPGILFLLVAGIGLLALICDVLAISLRAPALTAIPLLGILAIPGVVRPGLNDALPFALTAAAWLLVLRADRPRPQARSAAALGAAVVAAALIAPALLPPVEAIGGQARGGGVSIGVNPVVTLGDDLRRAAPVEALRYTSSDGQGHYLRLTALTDFSGDEWQPVSRERVPGNDVDAIGAAPGLGSDVVTEPLSTSVEMGGISGRWLPVPYPPRSIDGLEGNWFWERESLSVRADASSIRRQSYSVESLTVRPTAEQLLASGTRVPAEVQRYTWIDGDVPELVTETAATVTAGLGTNYERALALQSFFLGGEFVYSEDSPVEGGYDGTGLDVLARFLEERSGYCVHYASAMAVMARELGIPSRVAVGFLPGEADEDVTSGEAGYLVTTHDMHTWPELYFDEVGWVPFEPTPSRGVVPDYEAPVVDDPSTPDVDESEPAPVPTATSTPSAAPELPRDDGALPGDEGQALDLRPGLTFGLSVLAVIAVLLVPAAVRLVRRNRRVARGEAALLWIELRDSLDDLGLDAPDTETARALAGRFEQAEQPLARLLAALEREAYGAPAPPPADTVAEDALYETIDALARTRPLSWRLRARLLPRSLFTRFRAGRLAQG